MMVQSSAGFCIGQRKYAQEVLEKFQMNDCNSIQNPIFPCCKLTKDEEGVRVDNTLYKQIVGNLMYLSATRLISHSAKHDVCGTVDYGVFYKKGKGNQLIGFSDSDYARDLEDRKSTSGQFFMLSL
ncbi:hypothetical protein Prudu_013039 [Prunus dulcis]|uniref:Transposable element protein n=1 Tax=Prunus dulcis TaxID=3755 RepID=A0A4Y1REU8_PRUDU|nr:hypothetical protein Prudu_013039 [Prunus dulcis]